MKGLTCQAQKQEFNELLEGLKSQIDFSKIGLARIIFDISEKQSSHQLLTLTYPLMFILKLHTILVETSLHLSQFSESP